jgi:hypothetical protein
MSIAQETDSPAIDRSEGLRLNVSVIFTSEEGTAAAMRLAGMLASGWHARITLLVTQLVPFPRQLVDPPVAIEFNEQRFQVLADRSPVPTSVGLYLCRDAVETLLSILDPRSVIVIGGRQRWWPTAEKRLAAAMRRAGHEVIFARTE